MHLTAKLLRLVLRVSAAALPTFIVFIVQSCCEFRIYLSKRVSVIANAFRHDNNLPEAPATVRERPQSRHDAQAHVYGMTSSGCGSRSNRPGGLLGGGLAQLQQTECNSKHGAPSSGVKQKTVA